MSYEIKLYTETEKNILAKIWISKSLLSRHCAGMDLIKISRPQLLSNFVFPHRILAIPFVFGKV